MQTRCQVQTDEEMHMYIRTQNTVKTCTEKRVQHHDQLHDNIHSRCATVHSKQSWISVSLLHNLKHWNARVVVMPHLFKA